MNLQISFLVLSAESSVKDERQTVQNLIRHVQHMHGAKKLLQLKRTEKQHAISIKSH